MQGYFLVQEKKFLITLKTKYNQQKILNQGLNQQYLIYLNKLYWQIYGEKIIRDESNMKNEIFNVYFKYQNPS